MGIKLVVGLGNPQREYKGTRHNVGFMVLNAFAEDELGKCVWGKSLKFNSLIIRAKDFILAKPQVYMNSSGGAVSRIASYYSIPSENILVVHDDLDIPLGKYKLQRGRGSAGHRGVESIIMGLGTKDFYRLRVGIDSSERERVGSDEEFVLGKFSAGELDFIESIMPKIIEDLRAYTDSSSTR